jgi:hypothetical protein
MFSDVGSKGLLDRFFRENTQYLRALSIDSDEPMSDFMMDEQFSSIRSSSYRDDGAW